MRSSLHRLAAWWRSLFAGADDFIGEISPDEVSGFHTWWWR